MVSRLVLGSGSVGRSVAGSADAADELFVVTEDEHAVETLRADGVAAEWADPTDPAVLRGLEFDPDTVVVGGDDPERNRAAARAAGDVFPDAYRLAFAGRGPSDAAVADLEALVDHVVDPRRVLGEFLLERVGDAGLRTRRLRRVLRTAEPPLAVVAHDNPDPDAIASAVALRGIAERAGTPAEACYYGDISHQENRALVNLMEFDLTNLDPGEDLSRFGSVALVDHSRPGVNDQLPTDTAIDVVIDHHPPRAPVEARFVDLRSDVGATSTLLTGYLRALCIDPSPAVATGLLFGIQVDTDDFSRGVSVEDFEAAATLLPHADVASLERIESPSIGGETLDVVARAIADRDLRDDVLMSYVGEVGDRDALAQAADRLLDMAGIATTLVYGRIGDTVYASARARGTDVDLGKALRDAFGQIGSAGGHADLAGAQIPVGALVGPDEADPDGIVRDVVTNRFFETLGVGPDYAAAAVYAAEEYLGKLEEGTAAAGAGPASTGPDAGGEDGASEVSETGGRDAGERDAGERDAGERDAGERE
jgi:nanoRNase/pAp phosphatase (c-di-AMP/oligoRNAs hydrolase)